MARACLNIQALNSLVSSVPIPLRYVHLILLFLIVV